MAAPARMVVGLVALGLIAVAGASGYAYGTMRPKPMAAQVVYGSGRIDADEVRVAPEVAGRLEVNNAVEGQ